MMSNILASSYSATLFVRQIIMPILPVVLNQCKAGSGLLDLSHIERAFDRGSANSCDIIKVIVLGASSDL
jgi:hypothetical protein